jgi:hypothetical protein
VTGNVVKGNAIAGLFSISRLLLQSGSGIISSLASDGAITLDSGQVLRINDPNAVYSAGSTSLPEFTADDENPSIACKHMGACRFVLETDCRISLEWLSYVRASRTK